MSQLYIAVKLKLIKLRKNLLLEKIVFIDNDINVDISSRWQIMANNMTTEIVSKV